MIYIEQNEKLREFSKTHCDFIEEKLKTQVEDERLLKEILESDVERLRNIIKDAEKNPNKYKKLGELLKDFYENGWAMKEKYDFVKKLNLKVCPYCNRNYISVIQKPASVDQENKNRRPDIEHFYPKSLYPYLAMSFYNLLPACDTCNKLKSNFDSYEKKAITPYDVKKDEVIFSYRIENVSITKEEDIRITIDDKFKANQDMLGLDIVYQENKDLVLELLKKKQYYPESYIQELKSFDLSDNDIYQMIIGNYYRCEEHHKRPLAKLTKDIADELELLKR